MPQALRDDGEVCYNTTRRNVPAQLLCRKNTVIQNTEKLALLRQVDFFKGIDTAELELIAQQMTEQSYAAEEAVVREGDPATLRCDARLR